MGDKDGSFLSSPWFLRVLRLIGICVALACGAITVLVLFTTVVKINPIDIFAAVYGVIFALLFIVAELKIIFILQWFRFLVPFIGLGFFAIFMGTFLFKSDIWYCYFVGAVAVVLGVIYIILGCMGIKRMDDSAAAQREQKDKATKYAVSSAASAAQTANTAENRQALANSSAAENGGKSNPFDNDNPFNSGSAY